MGTCSVKHVEPPAVLVSYVSYPLAPWIRQPAERTQYEKPPAASIADRWPLRGGCYWRETWAHGLLVTVEPYGDSLAVAYHRWHPRQAAAAAGAVVSVPLPVDIRTIITAYLIPNEADLAALMFPHDGPPEKRWNIIWDPCGKLPLSDGEVLPRMPEAYPIAITSHGRRSIRIPLACLNTLTDATLSFEDESTIDRIMTIADLDNLIDRRALAILGPAP